MRSAAEVLVVVVFSTMSRWGCFGSTNMRASESYEEELGVCGVEVLANELVARFVGSLYCVKLMLVDTGVASLAEVMVLQGPRLVKAAVLLMTCNGGWELLWQTKRAACLTPN